MVEKSEKEDFKYIVRISGTDLDGNKKVPYGLTRIRGIGRRTVDIICNLADIDPKKKIGYLTDEEVKRLSEIIDSYHDQNIPQWLFNRRKDYSTGKDLHNIGSDLVMGLRDDLNLLRKIRSYRGIRHELGLPVRGQRTRTCFRKGLSVGVSRKKVPQSKTNK